MRRLLLALAACALSSALGAASACAATVGLSANQQNLIYDSQIALFANHLDVKQSGNNVTFEETAFENITVGAGCQSLNTKKASCTLPPGVILVDVRGGANVLKIEVPSRTVNATGEGGADEFHGGAGKAGLNTGAGDDVIFGEGNIDNLTGGPGNDILHGGAGGDSFYGDPGNDFLDGGPGGDTLRGGDDEDTASYQDHHVPVVVDIDNVKDDGAAGELDNVRTDVEHVWGGTKSDKIVGSGTFNVLDGLSGNDKLYGKGGNDALDGGLGADYMSGGTGDDTGSYDGRNTPVRADLDGQAGDDGEGGGAEGDTLKTDVNNLEGGLVGDNLTGNSGVNAINGRFGNDTIDGAGGHDVLRGDVGDDTFKAADGVSDNIDCGPGVDTVFADSVDVLVNCELPQKGAPGLGGSIVVGAPVVESDAEADGPRLKISPKRLRLTAKGVARFKVKCPASAQSFCRGRLVLKRKVKRRHKRGKKTVALGKRKLDIRPGKTKKIKIKLSRKNRRLIKRRKKLKVTAVGEARDAVSTTRETKKKVRLKPPKRR